MTRIKIEDLPMMEALDAADASGVHGGASYYRYRPTYRYTPSPTYRAPVYRPPVYNPGNYYNRPNNLIMPNRGW